MTKKFLITFSLISAITLAVSIWLMLNISLVAALFVFVGYVVGAIGLALRFLVTAGQR